MKIEPTALVAGLQALATGALRPVASADGSQNICRACRGDIALERIKGFEAAMPSEKDGMHCLDVLRPITWVIDRLGVTDSAVDDSLLPPRIP